MLTRIDTPRGPVFVRPGARDRAVVYVHGYCKTVEQAIRDHGLAAQFPTNATVIIPEAPAGAEQPVAFPSLDELLALVGAPQARVMALGHSGAYRTLRAWLASPRLREVALLDAAYGDTEPFLRWGLRLGNTLRIVGRDTAKKSAGLAAQLGIPYHEGKSHDGIIRNEGWIARFVASSAVLRGRSLLVPLVAAGGLGYLLYRALV